MSPRASSAEQYYQTLQAPKGKQLIWFDESAHWEKTGIVEVQVADMVPNGWQQWLSWLEVCQEEGFPAPAEEIDMLRADAGRTLGFTRLVARRK